MFVVLLFALSLGIWVQSLHAQDRYGRGEDRSFAEEELDVDTQSVTPSEEFTEEEIGEDLHEPLQDGEVEYPDQDVRTAPSRPLEDEARSPSPDGNAAANDGIIEEPQVMTSGPPTLPTQNSLPPREQVAVSVVAAGVTAMDKEDMTQARILFERAIEIAPLQPYSYFFLGRLAFLRGEHQKALPLLRKTEILLARGDLAWRSETMSVQGAVFEDLGEIPQARSAYRKSLRLFPQNLRAMSALARLAGEEPDSDDPVPQ